jgi:hypothetical protein
VFHYYRFADTRASEIAARPYACLTMAALPAPQKIVSHRQTCVRCSPEIACIGPPWFSHEWQLEATAQPSAMPKQRASVPIERACGSVALYAIDEMDYAVMGYTVAPPKV